MACDQALQKLRIFHSEGFFSPVLFFLLRTSVPKAY